MLQTRLYYLAWVLATIVIGLAVHLHGQSLGTTARDMLGDALWGAMIFWLVSVVVPSSGPPIRIPVALCICFAVELSQLYQGADFEALQSTAVGDLVLGSDFDPRDFVSYSLGVVGAALLDRQLSRRWTKRSEARME